MRVHVRACACVCMCGVFKSQPLTQETTAPSLHVQEFRFSHLEFGEPILPFLGHRPSHSASWIPGKPVFQVRRVDVEGSWVVSSWG